MAKKKTTTKKEAAAQPELPLESAGPPADAGPPASSPPVEAPKPPRQLGVYGGKPTNYKGEPMVYSHSAMEVFRESPVKFYNQYVRKIVEYRTSPQMNFGIAFDLLLMEPKNFDKRVVVCDLDGRTNAAKELKKQAEADRKVVITSAEKATAELMVQAVCTNTKATDLLGDSGCEFKVWLDWTCPYTKLPMKGGLDAILRSCKTLVDVKTFGELPRPSAFGKAAYNYGYHRQAALYIEGAAESSGTEEHEWTFLHVVICKESDHDFAVMVAQLDEEAIALGKRENLQTRQDLANCLEFDAWMPSSCIGVQKVALPRWAQYQAPSDE